MTTNVYILRLPVVCERTGDPRSTTYRKIKQGLMVPPIKLSERSSGWPSNEIDALIAARISGKSEAEIRELVSRLVNARVDAAQQSRAAAAD